MLLDDGVLWVGFKAEALNPRVPYPLPAKAFASTAWRNPTTTVTSCLPFQHPRL